MRGLRSCFRLIRPLQVQSRDAARSAARRPLEQYTSSSSFVAHSRPVTSTSPPPCISTTTRHHPSIPRIEHAGFLTTPPPRCASSFELHHKLPRVTTPHAMSRSLQDQFIDDDEEETCPLCVEEFDLHDKGFRPCPCGYQVCCDRPSLPLSSCAATDVHSTDMPVLLQQCQE